MHRPMEVVWAFGPSRGTRSVGSALEKPGGCRVIGEERMRRSDVFLMGSRGSGITASPRNPQTNDWYRGYSIPGATDRQYASMRIPSASLLPNKECRYG